MKKSSVLIILSLTACLTLTACSSKNSKRPDDNAQKNILQNIVTAADIHITEETDATDELSERLKLYKSFLQDEITSETKSDGPCFLHDYCNWAIPGKDGTAINYALYDMTGDGLPELHVLTDISFAIHTIEDNHLITWFSGDRYCRPLNNGAILEKIESTGTDYGYSFLDSSGEEYLFVGFSEPPKGSKINICYFGTGDGDTLHDIKVSKREYKKLTKPFLDMKSDKIIWKHITDLDFSTDKSYPGI